MALQLGPLAIDMFSDIWCSVVSRAGGGGCGRVGGERCAESRREVDVTVPTELDPDVLYPATPTVPESGLHSLGRFAAYGALRAWYAKRPDCWVGEDRNIYYRNGDPEVVAAPDVFVSFGVDAEALDLATSYRVWEAGAAPAFVLEIASAKTYRVDRDVKPAKYLAMGVEEYWRFDPSGGDFLQPALQGGRRADGRWRRIEVSGDERGRLSGHSAALDLTLRAEAHLLRFRDPHTGTWLPQPDEQAARADRAEATAAAQTARADQQQAAAAAERARRTAAEAELAALRRRLDRQ